MIRRLSIIILTILLLVFSNFTVSACDEKQTDTYILNILFGDKGASKSSNNNVKILLSALYLCSEQTGDQGQAKLDFLKNMRVSGLPKLSNISIEEDELFECSHSQWEYEYSSARKTQNNRKKILRNSVNKVFDFGLFNNIFGSNKGKCNSFAAILYYSHILCDYIADNPSETEAYVNGKYVLPFSGTGYESLNGGVPSFTNAEKTITEDDLRLSDLDSQGRAGPAYAMLSKERMDFVGPRPDITNYTPSGWNQKQYPGLVNTSDLYNRCHIIGRQFCGVDNLYNLVTGTRYFNETMNLFETKVADYIKETNNHVAYRVTPIYKSDNKIASGVQMEAYSIEDKGKLQFNVYCYNVQPGISINYINGNSEISDLTLDQKKILPFALSNVSENNPDLLLEMKKHFAIIFEDQKNTNTYSSLMNGIDSIASEARSIGFGNNTESQNYMNRNKCLYNYLELLTTYVPKLLAKESFFQSAFK